MEEERLTESEELTGQVEQPIEEICGEPIGEIPEEPETEAGEEKPKKRVCALCGRSFYEEDPAVLAVGGYGNHRYLCGECSEILDLSLESTDPETIEKSIRAIGETLASSNTDDDLTLETVNDLLKNAADRRKKIEDGSWVEPEENADEGFEEIPEELCETEEDREADEREQKSEEKANRIINWITIAAFAAVAVFALFKFVILR